MKKKRFIRFFQEKFSHHHKKKRFLFLIQFSILQIKMKMNIDYVYDSLFKKKFYKKYNHLILTSFNGCLHQIKKNIHY